MKPLALQMYSMREQAQVAPEATIQAVAQMGYKGVELAGFYDKQPAEIRKIVEDTGMVVCASHMPLADADNKQKVIDDAGALGIDMVGAGLGPKQYETLDGVKEAADKFNFAIDALEPAGITFYMHNHWAEFGMIDGRLAIDLLLEHCPRLQLQIDTYWCSNFGQNDPVEMVAKYKDRAPLLHIKDGPLTDHKADHVAVGQGKMDIPGVVKAADESVLKWLIVELDRCATDMLQAVRESCEYLKSAGLGHGKG